MKKLLSVLFMAFLAVSAFATVNVESEIGLSVYHDGSCERVGALRYIVTNETDFQSATTTSPIYIKIRLTDAAVLCHDLDGIDDAADNVNWLEVEVDNTANGWLTANEEVKIRGGRGWNYIEVRITEGPGDQGANTPNPSAQAWFRFGSTLDITGTLLSVDVFPYNDPDGISIRTKTDGIPMCFNYTGRVNGQDAFMENDINSVVMETYQGALNGSPLGVSYSPANPAIAYGGDENAQNWILVTSGKSSFVADYVELCKCFTSEGSQTITYTCDCTYRYGYIDFTNGDLVVALQEQIAGMLPMNSVIEMTVVDGNGNPLSTVAHGAYLYGTTTLTPDTANSNLAISAITRNVYATVTHIDTASSFIYDDGTCKGGFDACEAGGDVYSSFTWNVTAESSSDVGTLTLGTVVVARDSCDTAIDAYIKVAWYPYPCGAGGYTVLLNYPIHFIDCPEPGTVPTYKAVAYEYFSYFPDFAWWSGLAVTNVTYFYENYVGIGIDQDITTTLYLIEEDGDMYTLDGGTVPASGISTFLLSGLPTAPTLVSGTDTAFGDERFWVIVAAQSTNEYATSFPSWTTIMIDGFGMMGDNTQAQGFLPRIWNGGNWTYPTYLKK